MTMRKKPVRAAKKTVRKATIASPTEGASIGEWVAIGSIRLSAKNAKLHSDAKVEYIAGLIEQFGFSSPIIVDKDGEIIAGHGRYRAALKLGLQLVPVRRMEHLSERDAARLRLADNRSVEFLSDWDDQVFAQVMRELWEEDSSDLISIGYDDKTVARIIDAATSRAPKEDRVVKEFDRPKKPVTKMGDVWALGDHRLLCGDSTKRDEILKFFGERRASLLVTDPPYGVMYGRSGSSKVNAVRGDLSQAVIPISFSLALEVLTDDARVYLCGGTENLQMYWSLFDHHLSLAPRLIVWVKDGFVMRPNNYHSQFEIIYFGWKGVGGDKWFGDRKQSDVWEVARKKVTTHPTEKPVELYSRIVTNSARPGDFVFEPFSGSGVAIAAAEQAGRKCLAVEIDPGWCDVAVARWEALTGRKAEREK